MYKRRIEADGGVTFLGSTRPDAGEDGETWLDTSRGPSVLRVYSDGYWYGVCYFASLDRHLTISTLRRRKTLVTHYGFDEPVDPCICDFWFHPGTRSLLLYVDDGVWYNISWGFNESQIPSPWEFE